MDRFIIGDILDYRFELLPFFRNGILSVKGRTSLNYFKNRLLSPINPVHLKVHEKQICLKLTILDVKYWLAMGP
jgi:hypothetical protein